MFYSTVCSSDNRSAENTALSIDLSLSRDPTFVHKTPAAEYVLSASTDDGGILSKYLYTNFRPRPRLPLDSNIAISLRMGFLQSTEASVTRRQTSGSDDRHIRRISATANENKKAVLSQR